MILKNRNTFFAILLVTVLLFTFGFFFGYTEGMGKEAKKHLAEKEEQNRLLVEANTKISKLEKKYERDISDIRAEYIEQSTNAANRDAEVISDLRTGNERLRLQVTSCHSTKTDKHQPSSTGTNGGGSAELAPEASAALWRIASDGDRAIRKLTALQKWAEVVVQTCGGNNDS